jgi:hypothetical protein
MPVPKRERVDSTAIRSLGHDATTKRLDVEFRKSGAVYRYSGVSARVAANLENASSIGRHFVRNVRNNYEYDRIRKGTPRRAAKRKR